MVKFVPAGSCVHMPTDRGWIVRAVENFTPIVWCQECNEYVEMGVPHALRISRAQKNDRALTSVFEHMFTTKFRKEHPEWGELEVYSAYRHWKERHWAEVLERVGFVSENKSLTPAK